MECNSGRLGSGGILVRRFLSLAFVLAFVSLAVIPAAAQAAPHVYKIGSIVPEGQKLPFISWAR